MVTSFKTLLNAVSCANYHRLDGFVCVHSSAYVFRMAYWVTEKDNNQWDYRDSLNIDVTNGVLALILSI